ncbi:hypothetical protein PGB90_010553 [Kerria lacca]
MAANTIFKRGRHKNKTYEEVSKLDENFCRSVLQSDVFNDFYPEDFKNYLVSKMKQPVISERSPFHFLNACSSEMMSELKKIIGEVKSSWKVVHEKCSTFPNGFMGVFIRYYAKKCAFNIKDETAHSKHIEQYCSIFPFQVRKDIRLYKNKDNVAHLFDDEFKVEVEKFLKKHFEEVNYREIVNLFLANIFQFRKNNFSEEHMKALKNLVENLDRTTFRNNGDCFRNLKRSNYINTYLKNFPRLNDVGVKHYKGFYDMYNLLTSFHREVESLKNSSNYLIHLPEVNCYELFLLLNKEFFLHERSQYIKLFQKYIFFFRYAINSEQKPIFFIDDVLFECLKSYESYKNSRADIFDLQLAIGNIALVHRRKQPLDFRFTNKDYYVDVKDSEKIKKYIENFPNIKSATVEYEVNTDLLEFTIFMCTDDTLLSLVFSKNVVTSRFYELIIKAAVCPRDIKWIIRYNAYTGTETLVEVPPNKKEIQNFIRKYNKCDFTMKLPPEKFLTWGLEDMFVENTIDWELKYQNRL